MHAKRILVPVNLQGGDADALHFIENLSRGVPVHATLLHVVNLNIFGVERRVLDGLRHENEQRLRALAKLFFEDARLPQLRVRLGRPPEEILAEAEEELAELIVMTSPKASRSKWRLSPATVERVVRDAPCPTLVLPRVWRITPEQYREATRPTPAATCQTDFERAGA
jgi:nucleotide-binding universal stress UspA family protein